MRGQRGLLHIGLHTALNEREERFGTGRPTYNTKREGREVYYRQAYMQH